MNTPSASLLCALSLAVTANFCEAAPVVITAGGQTYSQDFDILTTSTTSQAWSNGATLSGWHLFTAGGAAITTYIGNSGGSNAGSFYSYGATGVSERALGGLGSGAAYFGSPTSGNLAGYMALEIKNTAGSALDGFTLAFNGEQWRNGGNTSAQNMMFEYGFGSTFAGVSTWLAPGGLFDWTSPLASGTGAAVNGNAAGRVSGRGGSLSLSWANDATLWLRWTERNDVGNDHGLAIDDLQFTAGAAPTPVPVPPALGLLLAGAAALQRLARRQWSAGAAAV